MRGIEIPLPELSQPMSSHDITIGEDRGYPFVVDRTVLGRAIDPFTGYTYRVVATRHNRDWPGTDSPLTFAVERFNHQGRQDFSAGFFSEVECWDYLTRRDFMELHYFGPDGEPIRELRRCLGIPDPYIQRG